MCLHDITEPGVFCFVANLVFIQIVCSQFQEILSSRDESMVRIISFNLQSMQLS